MLALDRHTAGLADFVASEEDHAPCCFCVSFKHIRARPPLRLRSLQSCDVRERGSVACRLILSINTKTRDQWDGKCESFHGTAYLVVVWKAIICRSVNSDIDLESFWKQRPHKS